MAVALAEVREQRRAFAVDTDFEDHVVRAVGHHECRGFVRAGRAITSRLPAMAEARRARGARVSRPLAGNLPARGEGARPGGAPAV